MKQWIYLNIHSIAQNWVNQLFVQLHGHCANYTPTADHTKPLTQDDTIQGQWLLTAQQIWHHYHQYHPWWAAPPKISKVNHWPPWLNKGILLFENENQKPVLRLYIIHLNRISCPLLRWIWCLFNIILWLGPCMT